MTISRLRGLVFKIETVILPPEDELELSVINLCSAFKNTFLEQCKEEIATNKRYIKSFVISYGWKFSKVKIFHGLTLEKFSWVIFCGLFPLKITPINV